MRKTVLNLIFASLAPFAVFAQNTQNDLTQDVTSIMPLKSTNQQIIEKVVNSGAFIIKQSYELADSTDNRYGLGGKETFGIDYTLAIKVKNGFVVSDRTIHPWDYNSAYDKYRKNYIPKLFPSCFSEVAEEAKYDKLMLEEDSLITLSSDLLYLAESEQFFGDGFSFGGQIGRNEGWMIWFTKKKNQDLEKCTDLNLSIIKEVRTISESNPLFRYPIEPLYTSDEIVGGIFVIPEIMGVGHLELKLCGMVCKITNGWALCCPFFKPEFAKDAEKLDSKVETQTTDLQLTPNVKKSAKDKKRKSTKKR